MKKHTMKDFWVISFGTAVVAVAVYFFMLPSSVSVGSISALANIISNFVPFPVSAITFVLNAVLLVIGYILIGRDFAMRTAYASMLLPVYLRVFEVLLPDFQSMTQDPFLDMLGYIFVVGVGLAILFTRNASTGGIDVVAKLMNKYLHMELGQAVSVSGMAVALLSALTSDKKILVISIIGTYLGGLVVDHFIFGMNIKRKVCIISPKVDEILHFIIHDLRSGASVYDVTGAYDNVVRREINAIVDKQEYNQLMEYVEKVDPKAFITVYSVNFISYQPKK